MEQAKARKQPTKPLAFGLSEKELSLTPMCNICGWRKGGLDSWNGRACKCGLSSLTFRALLRGSVVAV
jgi:hypothetical protein